MPFGDFINHLTGIAVDTGDNLYVADSRSSEQIGPMMKITRVSLVAAATVATAIALPATANAGIPPSFQTPSGNILCWVADKVVLCRIVDYDYAVAETRVAADCVSPGWPNEFLLDAGKPAVFNCSENPPGTYTGLHTTVTLDYGASKSVGMMTCASEPEGVRCTDTSTGHYFRVSRESYELH